MVNAALWGLQSIDEIEGRRGQRKGEEGTRNGGGREGGGGAREKTKRGSQ